MGDLSQRIHEDLKSAMIRQSPFQRNTFRLLKSALDYGALKFGKDNLSAPEAIRII